MVRHVEITRFPLKGAPKMKEVLAKNVPYAREAPKINFDRVFHTKAKTRSKFILEASRPGPLSPWGPLSKEILLNAHCTPPKGMVYLLKEHLIFHRDIVLQKHTALLQRKIALMKKGMLHFCYGYCMHLLAGMGMLMYIVITLKTSRISCKNWVLSKGHCSI